MLFCQNISHEIFVFKHQSEIYGKRTDGKISRRRYKLREIPLFEFVFEENFNNYTVIKKYRYVERSPISYRYSLVKHLLQHMRKL